MKGSRKAAGLLLLALLSMAAPVAAEDAQAHGGGAEYGEVYDPDRDAQAKDAAERALAEEARRYDAAIDRGLLFSHAETIGKDKIAANLYALRFLGVSYGVGDNTQLTLMTALDRDYGVLGNIKQHLIRDPRLLLTLNGRGAAFDPIRLSGVEENGHAGLLGVGLLMDYALDDRGQFSLHTELSVDGVFGDDSLGQLTATGGLSRNIENHLKIIAELSIPLVLDGGEVQFAEIVNFVYGLRLHWANFAADLSFVRTTFDEEQPEVRQLYTPSFTLLQSFPLGVPWFSFNARF